LVARASTEEWRRAVAEPAAVQPAGEEESGRNRGEDSGATAEEELAVELGLAPDRAPLLRSQC
jgi:hypothetical protein